MDSATRSPRARYLRLPSAGKPRTFRPALKLIEETERKRMGISGRSLFTGNNESLFMRNLLIYEVYKVGIAKGTVLPRRTLPSYSPSSRRNNKMRRRQGIVALPSRHLERSSLSEILAFEIHLICFAITARDAVGTT